MHPEAESQFRKYQHTSLIKGVIHAFRLASRILPLWFMRFSTIFIIFFFIIFNPRNFAAVMKNLSCIRPGASMMKRLFPSYRVFLNYAFYLIDIFYLSHDFKRLEEYSIEVRNDGHLREVLSMKTGFILLTLHMGNWEIGGALLSARGIKPYIVYSPDTESTIELQRAMLRDTFQVNDIPLGRGEFFSLRVLNMLRDGAIVAFQGDRLFGDSGMYVDFFGKKALFPRGPVVLAMVSGTPILPVFTVMKGYKKYELFIEKPYTVYSYSTREETIRNSLRDIVKIFEKYVSVYPEQWYAFMPFWKNDMEKQNIEA